MKQFLEILLGIVSIVIIVSVLFQDSKSDGLASLTESSNTGGYGRKTSKNYLIDRIVIVCSILFFIIALALAILS
ncbi:preprotein translocase subunit SecG [Miniphocaeibacter halophilus]|uniref:Preprotein translocase subunit SecG n=1 Tax=Miniphocaeibacter halophilus TaxID=2931922 RepID=A0AC61MQF6_9FIRM|nr:preprotein translocase subunit SecG [Miniphocaeibacter halophilus]QQK07821.1 preprotein translocase subunit SecG [Miniphocaeibacter halophilus]